MKDKTFEKIMDEIMKYYQKMFNQNTDLTLDNVVVYYINTSTGNIDPVNNSNDLNVVKPTPIEYKYFNMTMDDIDALFESGTDDEIQELIDIIVRYETTVEDQIKVLHRLLNYTQPFTFSSVQSIIYRKLAKLVNNNVWDFS
jgi:hypothetical protein